MINMNANSYGAQILWTTAQHWRFHICGLRFAMFWITLRSGILIQCKLFLFVRRLHYYIGYRDPWCHHTIRLSDKHLIYYIYAIITHLFDEQLLKVFPGFMQSAGELLSHLMYCEHWNLKETKAWHQTVIAAIQFTQTFQTFSLANWFWKPNLNMSGVQAGHMNIWLVARLFVGVVVVVAIIFFRSI